MLYAGVVVALVAGARAVAADDQHNGNECQFARSHWTGWVGFTPKTLHCHEPVCELVSCIKFL